MLLCKLRIRIFIRVCFVMYISHNLYCIKIFLVLLFLTQFCIGGSSYRFQLVFIIGSLVYEWVFLQPLNLGACKRVFYLRLHSICLLRDLIYSMKAFRVCDVLLQLSSGPCPVVPGCCRRRTPLSVFLQTCQLLLRCSHCANGSCAQNTLSYFSRGLTPALHSYRCIAFYRRWDGPCRP